MFVLPNHECFDLTFDYCMQCSKIHNRTMNRRQQQHNTVWCWPSTLHMASVETRNKNKNELNAMERQVAGSFCWATFVVYVCIVYVYLPSRLRLSNAATENEAYDRVYRSWSDTVDSDFRMHDRIDAMINIYERCDCSHGSE